MIRLVALAALCVALSGCAFLAPLATPTGMVMIGALAGAAAENAKLGTVLVCAGMSAEGIREDRTVGGICGAPVASAP